MNVVLGIFAHPDDAEFLCAGTLALLAGRGVQTHVATLTAGDCGSTSIPANRLAPLRRKEANNSAKLIGASYTCLGEEDLCIFYDRRTLKKMMGLVRKVRPLMVFTHSPADYMVDHECASRLVQTACFGAMAPNFKTGGRNSPKPLQNVPYLYYADPFGGKDILGNSIRADVLVDITSKIELKEQMVDCHRSQKSWLRSQQGIMDNHDVVRQMGKRAGKTSGFRWGEGFRQHLGQGFPQDNKLAELLGDLVLSNHGKKSAFPL